MQSKFNLESNGYNRREVNDFISEVVNNSKDIVEKCKKQQEEITRLRSELEKYQKMEDGMRDAIIKTEKDANEIISNAKDKASKIVNDALIRAGKTENKRKLMENNINIDKRRFKYIIKEEQDILNELEELELFD